MPWAWSFSLTGHAALDFLNDVYLDKVFISVIGFDAARGATTQEPEEALEVFTCAVEQAGADALIVHARKAWLKGLSPKENREIPPLDYTRVYRLKAAHPGLPVVLNGGIVNAGGGAGATAGTGREFAGARAVPESGCAGAVGGEAGGARGVLPEDVGRRGGADSALRVAGCAGRWGRS